MRGARASAALVGAVLLTAAGAAALLRVRLVRVASGSMGPTLREGDVVLTEALGLRLAPLRDRVVTARPVGRGGELLVKRVFGIPGDAVALRGTRALRNGRVVPEPWARYSGGGLLDLPAQRVPAGSVVVLGDRRDRSVDSRSFGPLRGEALLGRVRWRVWPPSRIGGVR